MPAKKVKGGFKVVRKDGSLGKRVFKTKSSALAAQRRGRKLSGGGGGSSGNPSGGSSSNSPGIGRSLQGGRLATMALARPTQEAIEVVSGRTTIENAIQELKTDALSAEHLQHVAVLIADAVIDKDRRIGQAAALSRGSVTAWGPELFAFWTAVDEARQARDQGDDLDLVVQRGLRRYVQTLTGYNARTNTYEGTNSADFVTYRSAKHIGQLVRVVGNRTKVGRKLKRPIHETVLKPLGLSL